MTDYPSIEHEYLHALGWGAAARWLILQGFIGEAPWTRAVVFLRANRGISGGQCLVQSLLPANEAAFAMCVSCLAPGAAAPAAFVRNALQLESIGLIKACSSMTDGNGPSKGDVEIYDASWSEGGHAFGSEAILHAFDAADLYWRTFEGAERQNLLGLLEGALPALRDGVPLAAFIHVERLDEAIAETAPRWAKPPEAVVEQEPPGRVRIGGPRKRRR